MRRLALATLAAALLAVVQLGAQIEGVPSRFLYFPDESHWVLAPQNRVLWHRVFFDWLRRYCK